MATSDTFIVNHILFNNRMSNGTKRKRTANYGHDVTLHDANNVDIDEADLWIPPDAFAVGTRNAGVSDTNTRFIPIDLSNGRLVDSS